MSGSAPTQATFKPRKRKRSRRDDGEMESKPALRQAKPRPPPEPIDDSIRHMDGTLLADLFAQRFKRHMRDLTTVEVSDLQIPATAFHNSSSIQSPRTLDKLPTYLEQSSQGTEELSTTCDSRASPHTLVITSSGIRAADIARTLRPFQSKTAAVSKLFAKHIKLTEAMETVRKTRIGIGVGTPQRVLDLLQSDTLKVENLRRIVLDASYLDQKRRSIFDFREIFVPLVRILGEENIRTRISIPNSRKGARILAF